MDQLYYYSKKVDKGLLFFSPQELVCTIEYHAINYIIEDLGHSWGTSLKKCLDAFFNKGLIRHLFFGGNLAFWGVQSNMAFQSEWPALLKEGGQRVVIFFHPKSLCAQ